GHGRPRRMATNRALGRRVACPRATPCRERGASRSPERSRPGVRSAQFLPAFARFRSDEDFPFAFSPGIHLLSKVSPSTREQLLDTFLRLAAVLQLTTQVAQTRGKAAPHAALEARLAIFRARVEAGEAGTLLAESLARFGDE